jgi:hypothetical protein
MSIKLLDKIRKNYDITSINFRYRNNPFVYMKKDLNNLSKINKIIKK